MAPVAECCLGEEGVAEQGRYLQGETECQQSGVHPTELVCRLAHARDQGKDEEPDHRGQGNELDREPHGTDLTGARRTARVV